MAQNILDLDEIPVKGIVREQLTHLSPQGSQRHLGISTSCVPQTMRAALLRICTQAPSFWKFLTIVGRIRIRITDLSLAGLRGNSGQYIPIIRYHLMEKTHWTMENGRNMWTARTEGYAEMRSTRENYYLIERLEAYENNRLIFGKELSDTISRQGI